MMWKANRTVFLPMLRHESSSTDHLYIDTLRSADTVGRRIQFCNCLKVNLNEEKRTKMTSPDCFLSSDMWLNMITDRFGRLQLQVRCISPMAISTDI